ncbi:MAG: Rieske 2Fe-2S domain-containing protein [Desulfobulbaceae bacterium]|nr:Rieske 2Fe-2S domain-containing protein [Desulfobulbaceae bacterium]
MDRRSLLKWAVRGIGLAVAAMAGIPALIAGFAPIWQRRPKKEAWQPIGRANAFPVGEMREIELELPPEEWGEALRRKTVYAWRPSELEAVVYSRSCTDLGCPLTFDPGSQCFFCPCHGGIFDKNGERLAGPPKRPMYRYAVRIDNGEIMINLHSVPLVA